LAAMTMPPVLRSMRLQRAGAKLFSCFGSHSAPVQQIGLDLGDKGVVIPLPRGVAEHAGPLVGQQDVLVLVHHVKIGLPDLPVGLLFLRLFEEFVFYVQPHGVAFLHPVVPVGALSVELDVFGPDIFLDKGVGQGRHRF